MLQQTQVDRVTPKFSAFIERFSSFDALAVASVAEVLRAWQGLGYNSRALRLKNLAEAVVRDYDGQMPSDTAALRRLPGVGAYTAAAIRVFAFDLEDAPIDTNVRRILHRHAFGIEYPMAAAANEIDDLARKLTPPGLAHDWNSALMDLGASICTSRRPRCSICPLLSSCAAAPIDVTALDAARRSYSKVKTRQETLPFKRTTRYARGRIIERLRALPPGDKISLLDLYNDLKAFMPERSYDDVVESLDGLKRDGLLTHNGKQAALTE